MTRQTAAKGLQYRPSFHCFQ